MTFYGMPEQLVSCQSETSEIVRKLHLGDNLEVMRGMASETVDLVYLDPPFNSNHNYEIVFRGPAELRPMAHLPAFEDVWKWDDEADQLAEDLVCGGYEPAVARTVSGLIEIVGRNQLMAYLVQMIPRLVEINRVLRDTGSVYLHCDPTASHYLKLVMDTVFGGENFRNEIVWCYRGGGVPRHDFARKHDVILRYSKSGNYRFNPQYTEYSPASRRLVESRGGVSIDERSRDLKRGAHMPDWWSDINSLQTWSPERTGYPKQKPLKLLERIIRSSTDEGDVVMDPFCGCGTTLLAAEQMNRAWIGVDLEPMAFQVLRDRFRQAARPVRFEVSGLPATDGSQDEAWRVMAENDPSKFERVVLGQIENCIPWRDQQDKGKGIDGIATFPLSDTEIGHGIVRVRGDNSIDALDVEELSRAVDEGSERGIVAGLLVCGHEPCEAMVSAAKSSGTFESDGQVHQRMKVVAASDLFRQMRANEPVFPST